MKIYLVSGSINVLNNTGFIISSHTTYAEAHEKALIGQYIHAVDVQDSFVMVSAGKMAKEV